MFDAQGFAIIAGFHWSLVVTMGQPIEIFTEGTDFLHKLEMIVGADIGAGADADPMQSFRSDLANAMELFHRQLYNKVIHLFRPQHKQAIRLVPFAGDLGQKLVGRHPGRHGNAHL